MTSLDWIVAAGLMAFLIWSVNWSRKFLKDVSSFVVAGRKTRMWLALSNNNSGGLGLVTLAYMGQEGFRHGFSITWITLTRSLVIIVLFGIFGFGIQRFRASQAMTGGQFHEMRYGKGVRILIGFVMGFGGVVNMAAFPIVGATFISSYLGWPATFEFMTIALPTIPVMVAVMIGLAVFFAVVCGQVGVILTDYIQGLVIMAGLFAITWVIYKQVGISHTVKTLDTQIGPSAYNPFTLGGYGLLWAIWLIVQEAIAPFSFGPVMNKFASADNPKAARRMMLLTHTFGQGKQLLMISLGVAALVVFGANSTPEGMDPGHYSRIAVPMYLNSICPPVLMGLLLSAFLFAFISTNDSYLLSWSSIIVNDVICTVKNKPMSPREHIWLLRIIIICIGVFLYFWGVYFVDGVNTTILDYILLTGTMFTGAAIAMLAGLYWKRANAAGAYAATLVGMIFPMIDLTLRRANVQYYKLNPQQAGMITIATAVLLLVILSVASKKPTKWIDYSKAVRESEAND